VNHIKNFASEMKALGKYISRPLEVPAKNLKPAIADGMHAYRQAGKEYGRNAKGAFASFFSPTGEMRQRFRDGTDPVSKMAGAASRTFDKVSRDAGHRFEKIANKVGHAVDAVGSHAIHGRNSLADSAENAVKGARKREPSQPFPALKRSPSAPPVVLPESAQIAQRAGPPPSEAVQIEMLPDSLVKSIMSMVLSKGDVMIVPPLYPANNWVVLALVNPRRYF